MRSATLPRPTLHPEPVDDPDVVPRWLGWTWVAFVLAAMLALEVWSLTTWGWVTPAAAGVLVAVTAPLARSGGWLRARADVRDLVLVAVLYVAIVGLFRLAFVGFGTTNLLGLFLSYATGLLLGVAGPIAYTVWGRGRPLRSLGIGTHNLGPTLGLGIALAGVQFAMTLWGVELPDPVDWVPLLVMSLMVGLFEAVFFRGFVQNRLEASFGTVPAVAGAAALYGLYHVGYGMGADEIVFLSGLGVLYAVAFRLVRNIFVLWPLLTPLGAFFNNLQAGDIELPWASIAGFVDVLALMAVVVWVAVRHQRRGSRLQPSSSRDPGGQPATKEVSMGTPTNHNARTGGSARQLVVGGAQVLGTLVGAPVLRHFYNRHGASDDELVRSMPGDDLVAEPRLGYTRAITIDAPVEQVWPWLVQFGQGRGGFYSYDALENLVGCGIHSVDRILPQHQDLAVGDLIRSGGDSHVCWQVVEVEPPHHLVLIGAGTPAKPDVPEVVEQVPDRGYVASTWQWVLDPVEDGSRTRLIVRQRLTYSPGQSLLWHIVEPLNFVMEHGMLRGIRDRAEGARRRRPAGAGQPR